MKTKKEIRCGNLEDKMAVITITKTYEHGLCDCCCDHPNDVLNFLDYEHDFINEKIEVKIKGE